MNLAEMKTLAVVATLSVSTAAYIVGSDSSEPAVNLNGNKVSAAQKAETTRVIDLAPGEDGPGSYTSGAGSLPAGYTASRTGEARKYLLATLFNDGDAAPHTDENGAPVFVPSQQALTDEYLYEEELNDHKKKRDRFISGRIASLPAHFAEEISQVEQRIALARKKKDKTPEELKEAEEALSEMKKLHGQLLASADTGGVSDGESKQVPEEQQTLPSESPEE